MNRVWAAAAALVVILGVSIVHVALAQGDAPRVVQASDGSLYLLKDGARFAVALDPIDDDELAAYSDGGTLASSQLVAALSAVSSAPAQASRNQAATDTAQVVGDDTAVQAPPQADQPATGAAATQVQAQPQDCTTRQAAGAKSSAACPAGNGRPASIAATPNFLSVRGVLVGGTASVTVQSAPGTTCSLSYRSPAGSAFNSVGSQTADANGLMTWTFGVGAQAGVGTLSATCGEFSTSNTVQIGAPGPRR